MGLHFVVLAKFHLYLLANSGTAFSHGCPAVLASMLVPFALRVTSNISIIRRTYYDLTYSLRLFLFQLTRIALDDDQHEYNWSQVVAGGRSTSSRFDRALRLVSQSITRTRRRMELMSHEDHEDALHELSMITL